MSPMEQFTNAGGECVVLMRSGDIALIFRPNNDCTPYIVPTRHVKGESDWIAGRYFDRLDKALSYYQSLVDTGADWIIAALELPVHEEDVLLYRQSEDIGACIDIGHYHNDCWNGISDGWRLDDVTHWRELPAPPGEELP